MHLNASEQFQAGPCKHKNIKSIVKRKVTKSFKDMITNNYPLIFKIALGIILAELVISLI